MRLRTPGTEDIVLKSNRQLGSEVFPIPYDPVCKGSKFAMFAKLEVPEAAI